MISAFVSVALGSALGGMARYFVSGFVARRVGETFPWGTLLVNVSGAFLIGHRLGSACKGIGINAIHKTGYPPLRFRWRKLLAKRVQPATPLNAPTL